MAIGLQLGFQMPLVLVDIMLPYFFPHSNILMGWRGEKCSGLFSINFAYQWFCVVTCAFRFSFGAILLLKNSA